NMNEATPMKKLTPEDPETRSTDVVAENVDRLRELFPEAFTEGRGDFEVLKQLLGGHVDERDEKYGLNWHGKPSVPTWLRQRPLPSVGERATRRSKVRKHRSNDGEASSTPPTEVTSKAKRRQFSAKYKRRILTEADACSRPGEIGALLRREGLWSS